MFEGFKDPVFEFNKRIIDSTHDLVVAIAKWRFMNAMVGGWNSLIKTVNYIKELSGYFVIAVPKDIGNTSKCAKAFLKICCLMW